MPFRLLNTNRRKKEHMFSPRTVLILTVFGALYVLRAGYGHHSIPSINCEKGPLTAMDSCLQDQSPASATTSEWSYSYAVGSVSTDICNKMSLNTEMLSLPRSSQRPAESIIKTDCRVLKTDNNHFCYSAQHLSPDGKSRVMVSLITNEYCADAHFFYGRNISLLDEKPQPLNGWQRPYKGIPEVQASGTSHAR